MPERTSYAEGTPSWVDLASADVDKSIAFYGALFGWEHASAGLPEETGGYGMFMIDGKIVAGVGPLQNDEQPPVWSTYIAVDDADATVAKATEAGGQVAMGVLDVMEAGRMAFLIDPDGAFVGIWQAGTTIGAGLVNEPGALGWNELQCRSRNAALPFYERVFGYEPEAMPGDFGEYTVLKIDGKVVAGLIEMNEQWPEGVPPHWHVYFVVADADASAVRVSELGGSVHVEPFDAPGIGRMGVVSDPNGTHFSVIALAGAPG
jgi:predicted enzyme related to lactoylglutathione lyase